jgi:hypothetical protein
MSLNSRGQRIDLTSEFDLFLKKGILRLTLRARGVLKNWASLLAPQLRQGPEIDAVTVAAP